MTLLRSVARSITIVAAGQLVMWVAAFAFTIAQARYLGPVRFGELSLALTYMGFISIVIDFGLGTQLSRIVAQRSDDREQALAATVATRVGLWLAVMPIVWLATSALAYAPELQEAILFLGLAVVILGVSNAVTAYLQGREEFLLPSVASVAQSITVTCLGVIVLLTRPQVSLVAAVFIAAALVNLTVILIGIRGRVLPRVRIEPRRSLGLLRSAVPLGLYAIATTFYVGIDMVILQRLAPAENVGWYAAAYRLFATATILPSIVAGVVLYPVLSRLSLGSRAELRRVIEKALTFLTLSGVAVGLVFVVSADRIVALLFPAQGYTPTATALRLLAPGLVFIYVNWVFGASLLGLHQERRLLKMAVAAAVLNPVANLVAIPVFQQDGAAVLTSLTELGVLLWLARSMPKDLVPRQNLNIAAKAVLAATAAALVVAVAGDQPLLLVVPLALSVYGAGALALQAVTVADMRALFTALVGAPRPSVVTAESMVVPSPEAGR